MFVAILTAAMSNAHLVTVMERLPLDGSIASVCGYTSTRSIAAAQRLDDLIALWRHAERVMRKEYCSLADASELAVTSIATSGRYAPASVHKMATTINLFFKYVEVAHEVSSIDQLTLEMVEGFIWARRSDGFRIVDVSPNTARNRRSFILTAFSELRGLGISVDDDLAGPPISPNRGYSTRLLTDDELERIRAFATGSMFTTRRPLLVAISEAGGSAPEIAAVSFDDLDLDAGTVSFRGSSPRVNPLTEWGVRAIEAWALNVDSIPPGRLCATDRLTEAQAAQSITSGLTQIISDAGFGHLPDVSARSIRLTFAAGVLERDGIVAATRFLGSDSLDSTAAALRFDWRSTP